MQRRGFILALGGAAVAWPSAARAQKAKPVIAILGSGAEDASSSRLQMSLLDAGMRELGLVQGQDYLFETRWAGSDASRFAPLAAELLAFHPSAVVVSTNLAALAVQKLSRTVPIIGTGLNTPVAIGLVESLARPGGNITGVATMSEDLELKLFEMMRETIPGIRRVMVFTNPSNPSTQAMLDLLKDPAEKQRIAIDVARVSAPADLEAAFAEMSRQPPGAVIVLSDNSVFALADRITAQALALRVPTFGTFARPFAQAGALLTYSRDPREAFQGVARLLKKILDGANPAELPFEQPTKFNLFVNLKTAKALGIEIPPALLATADEVIE
ncbi:putative ABC transport system substrate-binding protein [Bradyrhizobium lablabi]|uniref:Putative ABC transport system substrate-binding protein n=1 Tax=Bradyrhizobium lablabi TaxID=722472 RepID=A0A1M6UTT5_9BRAD|nr:ABC transporter substrate-binding protein [Bradyrhizobium lablabi]SHK72612.1 putative ABC transport system substrate-binding protein [Bradyrhizobium lablabi]